MNQAGETTGTPGLDWRAILVGAGTSMAVGFALSFLMQRAFVHEGVAPSGLVMVIWPLTGLVNDALGGAVAGFLARRRGVAHGALACVLASVAGLVITIVRMSQAGVGMFENLSWLAQMPFWMALGIAVGAGAGAIAVRLATTPSRE
jgi:hypothetical protein